MNLKSISYIAFFLSLLLPLTSFAQQRANTESRIWLSILNPSLRIEMPIADEWSMNAGASILFAGEYEKVNGVETKNTIESLPAITLEARYFTTRAKRSEMGKTTDYFSGGYLGIPLNLYVGKGFSFGALYGVQGVNRRTSRFFYNLAIGLEYTDIEFDKNDPKQGVFLGSTLGLGVRLK
ncbi:MAG: hypothetical protein ACPG4W_07015 [Flavobacteriales bacterium]